MSDMHMMARGVATLGVWGANAAILIWAPIARSDYVVYVRFEGVCVLALLFGTAIWATRTIWGIRSEKPVEVPKS